MINKRSLLFFTLMLATLPLWAAGDVDVTADVASRGLFLTLISVFFGGVLVSLTPCLYPMIPITLSVIGANSIGQKPVTGFLRAFVFVLGIAMVYTALGLVTSTLGVSLTRVLQYKIFWLFLSLFFGAMGLSMLGLFELQLPPSITAKLQGSTAGKGGFIGAFLVGMVTGVAASPCGSPVLASMAVFAAEQAKEGRIAASTLMFFVYAMGMGMLFMVLGAFPAFLKAMPRSGGWMEDIKKFLGAVLIGVAFYYLQFAFPKTWMIAYWVIIVLALLVGAAILAARAGYRRRYPILLRAWQVGAALLAVSAIVVAFTKVPSALRYKAPLKAKPAVPVVAPDTMMKEAKDVLGSDGQYAQRATVDPPTTSGTAEAAIAGTNVAAAETATPTTDLHAGWMNDEAQALALAKKQKKPVIIDFGADWCHACGELEEKTFPIPAVAEALKGFIKLRIDCSDLNDEVGKLQDKYGASTLPTVTFVDPTGKRISQFDLKKFEKPEDFIKRLEKVKSAFKKPS